jgi:hypothetical protein
MTYAVRAAGSPVNDASGYSVEFTYDADVDCHVMIYFVAEEYVLRGGQIAYVSPLINLSCVPVCRCVSLLLAGTTPSENA